MSDNIFQYGVWGKRPTLLWGKKPTGGPFTPSSCLTMFYMFLLFASYFTSLKSGYNSAADNWMLTNAGKRIMQFNVAKIFAMAYMKTATIDKP